MTRVDIDLGARVPSHYIKSACNTALYDRTWSLLVGSVHDVVVSQVRSPLTTTLRAENLS